MAEQTCQGEVLDGHEHAGEVMEYVRVCARHHQRRGWLCQACARPLEHRGPGVVRCGECPDDDPLPGVLIPAGMYHPDEAWREEPGG